MRGSIRRRSVSILAVVVLALLMGTLAQAARAAPHAHDGPGLYDPGCALAALATVDRHGGLLVAADTVSLLQVTPLAVVAAVEPLSAPAAADVRFRAPPRR